MLDHTLQGGILPSCTCVYMCTTTMYMYMCVYIGGSWL